MASVKKEDDFGMCRFCGTAIPIPLHEREAEKEEKDEYATLHCDCGESRNYQDEVAAEKQRAKTLKRAEEQIEQLFGTGANTYGFEAVEPEVGGVLRELAALIYDDEVSGATLNMYGNMKAQLGKTAKGAITVLRQKTTALKREV